MSICKLCDSINGENKEGSFTCTECKDKFCDNHIDKCHDCGKQLYDGHLCPTLKSDIQMFKVF